MKGVLSKRIFRMIGIVLGSVLGFSGAVVGVMAAMGKFNTPVVYPIVLEFEVNEQTIISGFPYNPNLDWETQFVTDGVTPTIESFILKGENPDSEHEVNKTQCYIWFNDNASSRLITLCDKDGHPLVKDSNNRYLVNCNAPIYYMTNLIPEDAQIDGKVVLNARSTNETLKRPESPLTIWIDRKVESIFVKDRGETRFGNDEYAQDIILGVDMKMPFEYAVGDRLGDNKVDGSVAIDLKPISKESAKVVELYFDVSNLGEDYGNDYFKVTPGACDDSNLSSPIRNFLEYVDESDDSIDNGVYYFQAPTAGSYKFVIAVFPTYQAKIDYEASIAGKEIENPNHHRTQEMLTTDLTIDVKNIDISKVGFDDQAEVVLDLYAQDDYIYLNNGSKDNNLGIYMKKIVDGKEVDDFTRLSEVNMEGFAGDVWSNAVATFGDIVWYESESLIWNANNGMSIEHTGIYIGENLEIIDYIYKTENENEKYYCSNGAAIFNRDTNEIKLLKAGSYLNFYAFNKVYNKEDGDKLYALADFEYEAIESGVGKDKQWNVITKEMPKLEEDQELRLGILAVNNRGDFVIDNFFAGNVVVSLNPVSFAYDLVDYDGTNDSIDATFNANTRILNMSITFNDAEEVVCRSLPYNKFIKNIYGSYNAFVYAVKKGEKSVFVHTVEGLTFVDQETGDEYEIVGYFDNDGNFINEIKLKEENVLKDNHSCELYMLRLQNNYQQTVEDLMKAEKEANFEGIADKALDLYKDYIILNADYKINTSLLQFTHDDPAQAAVHRPEFYQYTEGYAVTIFTARENSPMIEKIKTFYDLGTSNFKADPEYADRIDVTGLDTSSGKLSATYNVGEQLAKPKVIAMWFEIGGEKIIDLGVVSILDDTPQSIVLKGNGLFDDIVLSQNENDIKDTIKATLGYENNNFKYTFTIRGVDVAETAIFNAKTNYEGITGFQDYSNDGKKKRQLNVQYSSSNLNLFDTRKITFNEESLNILSGLIRESGKSILQINIGRAVGYMNVETNTKDFEFVTKEIYRYTQTQLLLANDLQLKYKDDENPLTFSMSNLVFITDVECVKYGDGDLVVVPTEREDGEIVAYDFKPVNNYSETVLSIINDDSLGWKIMWNKPNVALTIKFTVETVNGSKTFEEVQFQSGVSISVSDVWDDRIIYAGTTIQSSSLFDINAEGHDVTFVVETENGEIPLDLQPRFENVGTINIIPIIDTNKIDQKFMFTVVPNIVVKSMDKSVFDTETESDISEIYTLQKYKDVIYGVDNFYTKKVYYTNSDYTEEADGVTEFVKNVPDETLLEDADYSNVTLAYDDTLTNPKLSGTTKLTIGEMVELDVTITRELRLMSGAYELSKDIIEIENKHKVNYSVAEENRVYKSLIECDVFATVDGFTLTSINNPNNNFTVSVNGNKFIIETIVDKVYLDEPISLVYTKELPDLSTQTLVLTTNINVLPYTPNTKETLTQAYSGSIYDLFGGIFDAEQIKNDSLVEKLLITGIKTSKDGKNVAADIVENWIDGGSGYIKGVSNPACSISFNEIEGNELDILVEFTITYSNQATYTDYVELKILNRQKIKGPNYPESIVLTNGYFKFLSGYEQDALNMGGTRNQGNDGVYKLININYEPILVYTNSSVVIDFNYDDIKKISRAVVINYEDAETTASKNTNLKIELVGYQDSLGGIMTYANNINVNYGPNQIMLPQAQQGMFGTLIFKLSTESGNYVYYNIYFWCEDAKLNSTVNHEHKLELTVDLDETTKYKDLIGSIPNFLSTFKTRYDENSVELFLYEIKITGGVVSEDFINDYYHKNVADENVLINSQFNTITLGLVKRSGVQEYCFGTIILYVQPDTDIDCPGLNCEVPNGYFTKNIDAYEETINCPFNGWDSAVVSIESTGLIAQGYKVINNCIVSSSLEAVEGEPIDASEIIAQIGGTSVTLNQRVPRDLIFTVKYVYNETTTAYVTYTYLATVIPEQTSQIITIGQFDGTQFVDSVDIASSADKIVGSISNLQHFFGTYVGDYSVTASDANIYVTKTASGCVIDFPQGTSEGLYIITIEYSNFADANKTRTFMFKVLPGVHFVAETSNDSGSTASTRVSTVATNNYNSEIGSTLSFDYDSSNINYFKYTVAGLTVYTNAESRLKLSFNNNAYVIGSDIIIASASDVNFVHSAEDRPINITITVENAAGSEVYGNRDLYVEVIQTYLTLRSVYMVEGADHQNVVTGQTISLADGLLNTNYIKLIGTDGNVISSYNLANMGFINTSNPNYIEFTLGMNANANIRDNASITFNTVTSNTMCDLYLNNDAGLETNSVIYTYQIMVGAVDGLDYSVTSGYNGSLHNYISFSLKDFDNTKPYAQHFIIGEMEDEKNGGIFNVDGLSNKKVFEDGVNIADPTEKVINEELYSNITQYQITLAGYSHYGVYVILNNDTSNVELYITRTSGSTITGVSTFALSMGGVNGGSTIASGLTIVLNNNNIVENYNPAIDTSVYAGYAIHLIDDGVFDVDDSTLKFELADSSYTRDGKEYQILATETTNDLFKYTSSNKTIQTNAIASDVQAVINFLVKDSNDYVLTTVTYNVNIYFNMKFVVNGDAESKMETNFVLTNEGANFPIEVNFIDGSDVEETDYVVDKKETYYKVLAYDLMRIKSKQNDFIIDKYNVVIELMNDIDSSTLEVTKDGITFYKDYSGEIELKLSVGTKNGTYFVYWTIDVTPILDIELAKSEGSIISTNSSSAFSSGTSVNLINHISSKSEEGVAITVSKDSNFKDYINYGNVSVTYSYKTFQFDVNSSIGSLTSSELYALTSSSEYWQYNIASGSSSVTTGNLSADLIYSINLPNVPSTIDNQSYLVVYEVYLEYLNLTKENSRVEVCYVTYNVINRQQVKAYTYKVNEGDTNSVSSASVNVETDLTGTTKLDLFYYAETLTVEDTTYTLIYSGNSVKLDGNAGTIDGNVITFTDYKYDSLTRKLSKLNSGSGNYEDLGTTTQARYYLEGTVHSVFESNFSNILAYKDFIDEYTNGSRVNINGKIFTLTEIENGRYGVNLSDNGILFTNEYNGKLVLKTGDIETVILDDFRLYTTKSIAAKTNNGKGYTISEMGLGNFLTKGSNWNDEYTFVGVGTSPSSDWVYNASSCSVLDDSDIGTINIPNGGGNNEYTVNQVNYTGTGGSFYSVTKSYYYISSANVVVPNYRGVESYLYSVSYVPDGEGYVNLDLTNAVKVWKMSSDELVSNSASSFGAWSGDYELGRDGNKLTMRTEALQVYKLNNPNKKAFPTITGVIAADSVPIQLEIEFALPEVVQFVITQAGTSDITVSMPSGTNDLSEVTTFDEGYIVSNTVNSITISGTKINEYFTANQNETKLVLEITAKVGSNSTVSTFEVIIYKS